MSSAKKIVLLSSDGEKFEVDEAVARQAQVLKNMIEDGCADDVIPLPVAKAKTLALVFQYCKKHVEDKDAKEELDSFDAEFMKIDTTTLYHLITTANYLEVKGLMELCCQTVANSIKGKSVEAMREMFHIRNSDFTPEEEEEIRNTNPWAFD
ncbi:SKP1-like protein 1A [Tripterygium wilfordii]|uniref:SKP1-like protein 1A n=1 Tax=Tripterygium wilfordii TaxID=458696 RepID=UPI0018F8031A|nr:SKP1-like protein 1A [Tripterygium wilfordii]